MFSLFFFFLSQRPSYCKGTVDLFLPETQAMVTIKEIKIQCGAKLFVKVKMLKKRNKS